MWADIQVGTSGYTIIIYGDHGKLVDEYSATGNPHDSQAPGEDRIEHLTQYAVTTALDMLEEKTGRRPENPPIHITINESAFLEGGA